MLKRLRILQVNQPSPDLWPLTSSLSQTTLTRPWRRTSAPPSHPFPSVLTLKETSRWRRSCASSRWAWTDWACSVTPTWSTPRWRILSAATDSERSINPWIKTNLWISPGAVSVFETAPAFLFRPNRKQTQPHQPRRHGNTPPRHSNHRRRETEQLWTLQAPGERWEKWRLKDLQCYICL